MIESTRRPFACPFAIFLARPITARAVLLLAFVAVFGLGCRSQNSNDSAAGALNASFTVSATQGAPGLTVNFSDESSGDFDTRNWDFDNGETSTIANPSATFPGAGSYEVSLTVTGARGSDTTVITIEVADAPVAGFTCTPASGFAPVVSTCVSSAASATNISWEVSTVGAGVIEVASGASPVFDLPVADTYIVTQRVENAVGSDEMSSNLEVYDITITSDVPSGSGPGTVRFVASTGAPPGEILTWFVDGSIGGSSLGFFADLRTPGTYDIEFSYANSDPPLLGSAEIQHVVGYGPPTAAFSPSVSEGEGPLEVTFTDESSGTIFSWIWDFGDGNTCFFPRGRRSESDEGVCTGESPDHTYEAVGRYDVQLTVTGENVDLDGPDLEGITTTPHAVTVTILDPSFEEQGVAAPIAPAVVDGEPVGGWTPITPVSAPATAEHVALSDTEPAGADAGMPTDGQKWAALDGLGTDGSESADMVENGIRQTFLRPAAASVLEFDYVFLYSEPPLSPVEDAMTATVCVLCDDTDTVEILSARAEVSSPYAGSSLRYPTLGGAATRATPARTASLDLAAAFPSAGPDTLYTLTVRLTNAGGNGLRSPRAYVDHIRFTTPAAPFMAVFSAPAFAVAGEPAVFLDGTCPDPLEGACETPTNWRWDFGPDLSGATLPGASGSGEQDPVYTYTEASDEPRVVSMIARNADQESLAQLDLTVIAPVEVTIVVDDPPVLPAALECMIDFSGILPAALSPLDLVDSWFWDFDGWGTSSLQDPPPITIGQPGTWTISATVTAVSGRSCLQEFEVVLD
jgi:PKD repeat protein